MVELRPSLLAQLHAIFFAFMVLKLTDGDRGEASVDMPRPGKRFELSWPVHGEAARQ